MSDSALNLLAMVVTVLGIASTGPSFSLTEGRLPTFSVVAAYGNTPRLRTAIAVIA